MGNRHACPHCATELAPWEGQPAPRLYGFTSLFKAELVRNKGPWRSIDELEFAVAEYIDWFNHRRLHGEIGLVPPAAPLRT